MIARRLTLLGVTALVAACGPAQPAAGGASPTGGGAPAASAGCVSDNAARDIWTRIDQRLNQVVLDPQHRGLSDVATGTALSDLQTYIQTTLVDKHVTEREVDALDKLSVSDAACTAGAELQLAITTHSTRDDYLKPDGSVDHADPDVGTSFRLLEGFTRVGGVWKESSITRLDVPSASPQLV